MLKVNNRELTGASFKPARLEGRLGYGVTKGHGFLSRIQFKEYWFKLLGNLLFYFGLNSHGGIKSSEPTGCLVLEDYSVVPDEEAVAPFAFVVLFSVEPDKKHILTCANVGQVRQWMTALRQSSYAHLQMQRRMLIGRLEKLGGRAVGLPFSTTTAAASETDPDVRTATGVGPRKATFVSHVAHFNHNNWAETQPPKSGAVEDLIKF